MKLRATAFLLAAISPLALADGKTAPKKPSGQTPAIELPTYSVIGTPLERVSPNGVAQEKVPANVQSADDKDIQRHEALNITDFMRRNLGSVTANDDQNNPYQPNISYRGYFASPLLGTPIGLSVYQDGVRVNEAFGDTVNWDLIPQVATANIDVIPGSNPLFGLNTLGGALSVTTKSGLTHPGTRAQFYGGSFGRLSFQAEHGGRTGDFNWFFASNISEDNGWRSFSHSAVHQAFGKLGWRGERTDLDLTFTFADNKLNGVGPTPDSLYSEDQSAIYTARDTTENTLYFFNLKGKHEFTNHLSLSGNSYYRGNTVNSLNSNTGNLEQTCESFQDCQELGLNTGANLTGKTVQDGSGVNLQLNASYPILKHENQFTVGGGYNGGHTHFTQAGQDGYLNGARLVVGTTPYTTSVNVKGTNDYYNVFFTDTFSVTRWAHVNAAVSWNRADIHLNDKIGTALNGDHSFERWNPSAGLTLNPLKAFDLEKKTPLEELTLYGNYNEGFRAPTPVELACADPEAPCSLPNSFVADPSLKPVVSHTFEAGIRGHFGPLLRWSMALYHSRLDNDILFVNSTGSNVTGYFQNVGTTQRQGGELGLGGKWDRLQWYLNYSYVDATYRTAATLNSALGPVDVQPGDYIPGIPQQSLKLGGEYEILDGWFFGGDLQYASSQWARGDDSNKYAKVKEYVVVNLNTRYRVTKNVEVFAMARNIFNTQYQTFGVMNRNFFTGEGERFVGTGAPIAGWAGVRLNFD